ncbi:MAG: hypothetical protein ACKVS6_01055 [Planctomycetota bacterium]
MTKTTKDIKDLKPAGDERAFLGEEFLTWLWWRADTGNAEFELSFHTAKSNGTAAKRTIGIVIEPPLLFRSPQEDADGKRPEQLLRFGQPLRGAEAAAGLRAGKKLVRAKLTIGDGARDWSLTFDAETFSLKSVRVPEPDATEDSGDRVLEYVAGFDELIQIFDQLFRLFLAQRLSGTFKDKEFAQMKSWARAKAAG